MNAAGDSPRRATYSTLCGLTADNLRLPCCLASVRLLPPKLKGFGLRLNRLLTALWSYQLKSDLAQMKVGG